MTACITGRQTDRQTDLKGQQHIISTTCCIRKINTNCFFFVTSRQDSWSNDHPDDQQIILSPRPRWCAALFTKPHRHPPSWTSSHLLYPNFYGVFQYSPPPLPPLCLIFSCGLVLTPFSYQNFPYICCFRCTCPAFRPHNYFSLQYRNMGPASSKMGTGSFPGVKCGRGVLLTTHPLLVPRSWKSRAIPLPTLWATSSL